MSNPESNSESALAPTAATIERDLAFAIFAARTAGERALSLTKMGRWEGRALADVGDQACDGYLQGLVTGRYPDDGLLSEETADSPERLAQDRAWIVDPLDGTKEFGQGREDWAVHVALTWRGACSLAAVALPAQDRILWGVCHPGHEACGIVEGGELLAGDSAAPGRPRIAISRSHTPEWVERFIAGIEGEPAPAGSAGNKVGMLLTGAADVYVHKVGLKEWDTCAPETVARSAGWHVCKLRGEPHAYNQADPYNHELVVCRPAMAERVLETLAACGALAD